MKEESSATRHKRDEVRRFVEETARHLSHAKTATIPLWLLILTAVFPMVVIFLSLAGAAYVGSYRLNEMEKVMARVEGALSTIKLVEYRVTTLEEENRKRERDIRTVERIAQDNKTNVRTAAHDIATFRSFLPMAAAANNKEESP